MNELSYFLVPVLLILVAFYIWERTDKRRAIKIMADALNEKEKRILDLEKKMEICNKLLKESEINIRDHKKVVAVLHSEEAKFSLFRKIIEVSNLNSLLLMNQFLSKKLTNSRDKDKTKRRNEGD